MPVAPAHRPERAAAQAWASFARLLSAETSTAPQPAAAEARSAAVSARDHVATSIAMATLATNALLTRAAPLEALQIADDAVRLADQSPGRQGHRFPVHIPRGYILAEFDRLDEARTTIETGMRISEELGTRWGFAHYQMARAMERFLAGNWDDAVAEIETDAGPAGETGQRHSLILGRSVLALIRLHRNDLPGARDAAARRASCPPPVPATALTGPRGCKPFCWRPTANLRTRSRHSATTGTGVPGPGARSSTRSSVRTWSGWPWPPVRRAGPGGRRRGHPRGLPQPGALDHRRGAALPGPGREMTPACWRRRSTPTPAGRARLSSRSPARTRPPRPRGGATRSAPVSSSTGRSPSTSASMPRATSPGPRPRCGRGVSAAAAGSPTAARRAAGRA